MKITKTQLSDIIKEEIENLQKENFLKDLLVKKATKYICSDLSAQIQAKVNLENFLPDSIEVPRFVEAIFDRLLGEAVCQLGTHLVEEASTSPEILEFLNQFGGSGLFEDLEEESKNENN